MSASNYLESALVAFIFNNTALPTIPTTYYISLHLSDPGETGNQESNEADYTGYARVAVTRDSSGWNVAGNQASNAGTITFPQCTGGVNEVTHVGIGTDASGPGNLLFKEAFEGGSSIISNGAIPRYNAGAITITYD